METKLTLQPENILSIDLTDGLFAIGALSDFTPDDFDRFASGQIKIKYRMIGVANALMFALKFGTRRSPWYLGTFTTHENADASHLKKMIRIDETRPITVTIFDHDGRHLTRRVTTDAPFYNGLVNAVKTQRQTIWDPDAYHESIVSWLEKKQRLVLSGQTLGAVVAKCCPFEMSQNKSEAL